jgi:hypothetical protein
MHDVVDLEHWRRAHRLCPILVDRFGAAFFVVDARTFSLDEGRVARCTALAAEWIGRRSGRDVDDAFRLRLSRLVRELVFERLAEGSVSVR